MDVVAPKSCEHGAFQRSNWTSPSRSFTKSRRSACFINIFALDGKRLNQLDTEKRYDRSSLCISSMQQLKNLRRVTLKRVGKLVWETSTLPYIEQDDDGKNEFRGEMKEELTAAVGNLPTNPPRIYFLDLNIWR